MPGAMLNGCLEQSTQRNVRNGRNVRVQNLSKSSSVPDSRKPVDNGNAESVTCPEDHAHDANATCYVQHKCRCDDCRRGRAEYEYWRKGMLSAGKTLLVDATGSHRRIRALGAIGWSHRMLGDRYGKSPSWFSSLRTKDRVTPQTRALVSRIYDDLAMVVPVPSNRYEKARITKTRNYARNNGYGPPLAWDDDVIDDPAGEPSDAGRPVVEAIAWKDRLDDDTVGLAIDGKKPKLSPLERRAAIRVLNERRWSERRIGAWLGCDPKTVGRIRAELNLPMYDQADIRAENWKAVA